MQQHKGAIVEEMVRRSGFPLKELAKQLGMSRNTLHSRFKDPELNDRLITEISNIIHYNFAIDFPDLSQSPQDTIQYYSQEIIEIARMEHKYANMLEQYNELLGILTRIASDRNPALRTEIRKFLAEQKS